ncbi:MAG TPA: TetR family transcriptional regulator [Burkholderiales bacterium]
MTTSQLRAKPRTRAVGPEEKTERRTAILRAAEELLHLDPGGAAITVENLARRAGLAKGTVYLYFRTREDVLLQVHLARLHGLFDELEAALEAPRVDAAYHAVRATLSYLGAHPEFLPLATGCRSMLETNTSAEAALEFKLSLGEHLSRIGARIEQIYPDLAQGDGMALLMSSYALMIGLWQITDPPECLREAMQRPELAVFRIDYDKHLAAALLALWAGAVSQQGGNP